MIFRKLILDGAILIEPEKKEDERGFFARVFCQSELIKEGLKASLSQCNISYNKQAGTLRGLHYQRPPHAEVKIVRCTAGAIYDVIVDLRPGSPTSRQWIGMELSAKNRYLLYVPEGFAHGYQTLTEDAEVFYQTTTPYCAGAEKGLRWNDPSFNIEWPLSVQVISQKDREHPLFLVA